MKPRVLKWLVRDFAGRHFKRSAAALQHLAYRCLGPGGFAAPGLLLRAHRYAPTHRRAQDVKRLLAARPDAVYRRIPDDVPLDEAINRSVVLRSARRGPFGLERGVILVKFTNTSRFYFHHIDLPALQEEYAIVLEPSWAGYAVPEILFWGGLRRSVLVQASDPGDQEFLQSLDSALVPVSFGSSDWVDYRVFRPLDPRTHKEFDATYVANYSPTKRVHVLFRALAGIAIVKPEFRAALVCSSWGGQRGTILDMLHHYGVLHMVTLFEDLSQQEVNEVLNRSRCNMLLSSKEGSNRSLFEAMFADIPVILLDDNIGVNRTYINEHTGVVVSEKHLWQALLDIADSRQMYSPRKWALENISPERTTGKLAAALDKLFPGDPNHFKDLVVKVNAPEATYFREHLARSQRSISERVLRAFLR